MKIGRGISVLVQSVSNYDQGGRNENIRKD